MTGNLEKRIVMTRDVAARWVSRIAMPEFRLRIFHGSGEIRNIAAMLRTFRDGKTKLSGVTPVRDFGIRDIGDATEIWSGNRTALTQIQTWFESRGFETTGVC